jgi:UTP--glucose-1-phosphate uridylyltransferase
MDLSDLPSDLRETLSRYRFDPARLERQSERLRREGFRPEAGYLPSPPSPAPADAIVEAPARGSTAHDRAERAGLEAIRTGTLGCVVLAGGMATRFGGVVKAAAECLPGRTFLDLKLADAGDVPVAVMTSHATDAGVRDLLARLGRQAIVFAQSISLRLTASGELFLDEGAPSPYAPGHGDVLDSLAQTGTLDALSRRGVQTVLVSNVDNLGASPDPAVLGLHLAGGRPVTVEVVGRGALDRGGAPAVVDGRVEIVEALRVPPGTDTSGWSTFNTNTIWIDTAALARPFALGEFAVVKKVHGKDAIQHETLVGQITHFLDATYLRVPRGGREGRFLPVKDPEELAERQAEIRERLAARGIV